MDGGVSTEEFMKIVLKYGVGERGMRDFSKI